MYSAKFGLGKRRLKGSFFHEWALSLPVNQYRAQAKSSVGSQALGFVGSLGRGHQSREFLEGKKN